MSFFVLLRNGVDNLLLRDAASHLLLSSSSVSISRGFHLGSSTLGAVALGATEEPAYITTISVVFNLPAQRDYPVQLRTWFGAIPPPAPVVTQHPFAQYDWPLTPAAKQPLSIWTPSYNLNLIGKDQLPVGEVVYDLPPRGYTYPLDVRTITKSFNLNLIGQDQLPVGEIRTELARGYEYHVQLRNWNWQYNLNLIAQDAMVVGKIVTTLPPIAPSLFQTWVSPVNIALTTTVNAPFAQFDWPLSYGPKQPDRSTIAVSYNPNLIGQDRLPAGEVSIDLPPRAPQQSIPIWTASFNKNLIGKDQLPNGTDLTALPPRDYERSVQLRTWIQTVNLALVTQAATLPFNQYDWPVPKGAQQPTQIFTASFNKNLIGKDRLPVGGRAIELAPRGPQQSALSWATAFNLNLRGKDRLPIRQQDWPLPRDGRQPYDHGAREFVSGLNLALKFPPGLLPKNQYTWPNPAQPAPMWSRYNYIYDTQTFYPIHVSPIPPAPTKIRNFLPPLQRVRQSDPSLQKTRDSNPKLYR